MTGSNCSIVGCTTNRNTHKDRSIFRLPTGKKSPQALEWRKSWLNVILKDRDLDNNFKKQIQKNNVFVCERHFKETDLLQCKFKSLMFCKQLFIDSVISSLAVCKL